MSFLSFRSFTDIPWYCTFVTKNYSAIQTVNLVMTGVYLKRTASGSCNVIRVVCLGAAVRSCGNTYRRGFSQSMWMRLTSDYQAFRASGD